MSFSVFLHAPARGLRDAWITPRRAPTVLLATALASVLPPVCLAADESAAATGPRTAGWLQYVDLLPHRVKLTAKLDTGAKSSSIHADHIEVYRQTGVQRVRFSLHPDHDREEGPELTYDLPVESTVKIKRHDGLPPDERYTVLLDFCIDGEVYTADFGLDDRSSFNYPILLGREMLAGKFIVDPAQTFVFGHGCPASAR